ncbi:hypothetical protein OAZ95_00550 [Gammaproteobacteria bacterium]|nr:hypothetical protein [Gammaproteobacteria bacterium]
MKKIFITSILFYSFQGFSEEYLCSGIVGDETQIKSYERKGDYFLYTTRGWDFKILHENEIHIMLGNIAHYPSLEETSIFLTIIDKDTLTFTERFINSDNDTNTVNFLKGNCLLR